MDSPKLRILVSESQRFSREAESILREVGEVEMGDLDRSALLRRLPGTQALWVRLRNQIDAAVMDQSPELQYILSPTTGLNHIDMAEASRRGISVISLRGETGFLRGVRATAEHTIGLMLALLRHLPEACLHASSGGWDRDLFWGNEIHGKTVGVIGFGRLGRIVADYLLVFGARVLAVDPWVQASELPAGVRLLPSEQVLAEADVVTLHVALNESTRGFFGRGDFGRMRDGAWFINTGRGELVDEEALLDELRSGRLSGAALDVLQRETSQGMAGHPLVEYARTHKNLLITPHIGGCTFESVAKAEVFLAKWFREICRQARAPKGTEGEPSGPQSPG